MMRLRTKKAACTLSPGRHGKFNAGWTLLLAAAFAGFATHGFAATDLTPIVAAAQAAPAEFEADALLLVVARQRAEQGAAWPTDRAAAVARLEKVYALGFKATAKFPMRPVASSDDEALTRWLSAPLDRVSLQMAAALDMVALDPVRAMAMFARDEKLKAAVAACGAAEMEDYSKIYTVAAALLKAQAEPDPKFVEERLDRARSATALAPVLTLAVDGRFTSAQYADIARWAGDALRRIRADDQGFFATLADVDAAVAALRSVLADKGVSDAALKEAYAAYLTQNLAGRRCPENAAGLPLELQQAVVESNREDLGLNIAAAPDAPERSAAAAPGDDLLTMSAALIEAIGGDEDGNGILPPAQLASRTNAFLNAIDAAGSQADDARASLYKARVNALIDYLEFAPSGSQRARAKNTVLALVSRSPLYQKDPRDWFVGLKRLLQGVQAWPERDVELQSLAASANPVLRTYALLAREDMIDPAGSIESVQAPAP